MVDLASLTTEGTSRCSRTAPVLTTSHLMTYKVLTGHPAWVSPPHGLAFTTVWAVLPKHNLTTPIWCLPACQVKSTIFTLGFKTNFSFLGTTLKKPRRFPSANSLSHYAAGMPPPPLFNTLSHQLPPVIQDRSESPSLCNKPRKNIDTMMGKKEKKG